jgi:hypothetical protein
MASRFEGWSPGIGRLPDVEALNGVHDPGIAYRQHVGPMKPEHQSISAVHEALHRRQARDDELVLSASS